MKKIENQTSWSRISNQEAVAGGQHQKICVHVLLPGRSIIDHAIWLQLPNRALASMSTEPGMQVHVLGIDGNALKGIVYSPEVFRSPLHAHCRFLQYMFIHFVHHQF